MEKDFELIINSFIDNNIGVADHFLSQNLANQLKINLERLFDNKLLIKAGTGNAEKPVYDTTIRGDSIYWLDKKHENKYENEFFTLIEDFIKYLNISCYAGITDYEFHYSLYEIGSFYKKHLDQFQDNQKRQYSMISYLNEKWEEKDGGELLIYQLNSNKKIAPNSCKTVFFKSNELAHEVLLTNERRMSVTGWLKST
ncbi:MAG: 2OG-Fe(II) oxygenase [Cytophagales bacterium]